MKMFAIQNEEGKFLRRIKNYGTSIRWKDGITEATLFRRKCDATITKNANSLDKASVKQIEVRLKVEQ